MIALQLLVKKQENLFARYARPWRVCFAVQKNPIWFRLVRVRDFSPPSAFGMTGSLFVQDGFDYHTIRVRFVTAKPWNGFARKKGVRRGFHPLRTPFFRGLPCLVE